MKADVTGPGAAAAGEVSLTHASMQLVQDIGGTLEGQPLDARFPIRSSLVADRKTNSGVSNEEQDGHGYHDREQHR